MMIEFRNIVACQIISDEINAVIFTGLFFIYWKCCARIRESYALQI